MVYGRLSAGVIRLVPASAVYEDQVVTNPPGSFLTENNWKPVVFVLKPAGDNWVMNWFEETNAIVQVWSQPVNNSSQGSDQPAAVEDDPPANEEVT